MINKIGLKYIAVLGALTFVFANFIACGAQFYKVSLEEDIEQGPNGATNSTVSQDPASPTFGIHAPEGWTQLPIRFYVGTKLSASQIEQIRVAKITWEWALGFEQGELFEYMGTHPNTTGDSFQDLYSSLDDNVNGHYKDSVWTEERLNKPSGVLATTIWNNDPYNAQAITGGDIRFNDQYYIIDDSHYTSSDGQREVVDMLSLSLHELGHLIGLHHVSEDVDPYSCMNPRLFIGEGLSQRSLSRGDIERVQAIYGCRGVACDIDELLQEPQPSEIYDSQSNRPTFALSAKAKRDENSEDEESDAH